jgi:hypothetical protein
VRRVDQVRICEIASVNAVPRHVWSWGKIESKPDDGQMALMTQLRHSARYGTTGTKIISRVASAHNPRQRAVASRERSTKRLSPQVGYARTTQAVCEVLPVFRVKVGGRNVEQLLRVRRTGEEII